MDLKKKVFVKESKKPLTAIKTISKEKFVTTINYNITSCLCYDPKRYTG